MVHVRTYTNLNFELPWENIQVKNHEKQSDIFIENLRTLDAALREAENVIQTNTNENKKQIEEITNKNAQFSDLLPSVA